MCPISLDLLVWSDSLRYCYILTSVRRVAVPETSEVNVARTIRPELDQLVSE
jgi:hypothetical protein